MEMEMCEEVCGMKGASLEGVEAKSLIEGTVSMGKFPELASVVIYTPNT